LDQLFHLASLFVLFVNRALSLNTFAN
jgi:hypothetical protein